MNKPQVYKIPSDEYNSYIVMNVYSHPMLIHSGKITPLSCIKETSNNIIILKTNNINFMIPCDELKCSYPKLKNTVLLEKINDPVTIILALQAVKFKDPNAVIFEKSNKYRGSKLGYVFKNGDKGLGYYLDPLSILKGLGQNKNLYKFEPETLIEKGWTTTKKEPVSWTASGEPIYEEFKYEKIKDRSEVLNNQYNRIFNDKLF